MSTTIYHSHHIIPKHAGGTDEPTNLIKLTIDEHAEAHRVLYEKHNRWQDKLAWKSLSGMIDKEEILWEIYHRPRKHTLIKVDHFLPNIEKNFLKIMQISMVKII